MKLDKHQIAHILSEVAAILEIKGENPFKVRAYENAARIVEGLVDELGDLIAEKKLIELKGIGKNLAEHITELATTGALAEHEKLRRSVPAGVLAMLAIPGVGAKKARVVWTKLKVTTIAALEQACRAGKVAQLEGFGEKSQEKILKGIENLRRYGERHLCHEVYPLAFALLERLRKQPGVKRAEVGGSIRRRSETVKDIDFLVATDQPDRVMNFFVSLSEVEQVVAHGETKSSVIFRGGINADLRAVTVKEFPFALHYFTGSKAHNVAMRSLAKKHNLKLNEYGLFKGKAEQPIACVDEAALFAQFGLAFIPPELREDGGEMAAAAAKKLPTLVEEKDLQGVLHVHTTYSDGRASLAVMAEAARRLGFSYIGISDHSQAASYAGGMKPDRVKEQQREIDALNKKLKGMRILKGIECDILADGSLDYNDQLLASFDFVIASIHSKFNMTEAEMTKRICRAISNPHVDILAHPTGRLLLTREPYPVNMHEVIDCAAGEGVAIEINSNPQRLDLDWRLGPYAKEQRLKTSINPDAHSPDGLAHTMFGVGHARKGWFEKKDVLNCLSVNELLKYFQR